jgi:hypothetical protein
MKQLRTKPSYALYTMLLLVFFTSCSSDTTMFWNWKDVIGLSILGILILAFGVIMLIEWITPYNRSCVELK